MNSNDIELLQRYVFERSEAAFTELVRQHLGLVYSAALRQVHGDAPLAEEITQAVFTALAHKATRLVRHTCLAAWLHTTTRYAAASARRAQDRRCAREQEAYAMSELLQPTGTDPAWEQLRPVLDEAMGDLREDDREVVLLRFFERLPLNAVGGRFGITENAARMRVERALERLRTALIKRGVTSTGGALAAILAVQAVGSTPAGLSASVSNVAFIQGGAASVFSVLLARFFTAMRPRLLAGTVAVIAIFTLLVWRSTGPNQKIGATSRPVVTPSALSTVKDPKAPFNGDRVNSAASAVPANWRTLRLTILAADVNKPVPGVDLECTAKKDKQQTRTAFVSQRDGFCNVLYPPDTEDIELVSRTDGFADTVLRWEPAKGDTIPTNYTLRLIRAVHIGGYVKEEDGAPVVGAKVIFRRNMAMQDPAAALAHENHEFKPIEAVTDAEGRWSMDRIAPELLWRTGGAVAQPGHLLVVAAPNDKPTEKLFRDGTFVFKLSRGLTVRGAVVDTKGEPIPKASVVVGMVGQGDFQEATTVEDGSFVATPCRPGETRLAASAKGFAPKVINLNLGPDPDPIRIILSPGRILRLKVVDQAGQPVPGADIFAVLPGSIPALLTKTDAEGRAMSQDAPAKVLAVQIYLPGAPASEVEVTADGEEHLVTLARVPVVSGSVTDAVTGEPIPRFRVICGTSFIDSPRSTNLLFTPSQDSQDWLKFSEGKFRYMMNNLDRHPDWKRIGFVLKFEADGYAPSLSRIIRQDENEVRLDVALRPAQAIKITVLNPNGRPAANAEVGLLSGGTPMTISGGHLRANFGSGLLQSSFDGTFQLPPDESIERVLAINDQGYAESIPTALSSEPTLRLQPFGRLKGLWAVRNQRVPQKTLTLSLDFEGPVHRAKVYMDDKAFSATVDEEGRFVFPKVPPGKYNLARAPEPGAPRVPLANAEVRPGETTTVTVGGYVVDLRLRLPEKLMADEKVRTEVTMHAPYPAAPETIIMANMRTYQLAQNGDRSWTAEAVQAGTSYTVEARVIGESKTNSPPTIFAYGRKSVTIPAEPATGQIDLGEILLQSPAAGSTRGGGP